MYIKTELMSTTYNIAVRFIIFNTHRVSSLSSVNDEVACEVLRQYSRAPCALHKSTRTHIKHTGRLTLMPVYHSVVV